MNVVSNHSITAMRLELSTIDLKLENRRVEIDLLEAERAELARKLRRAVFADVAGYGEGDTPSMPKRSAYTADAAGDAAFARAEERWERYVKLAAAEWPDFHLDFVGAAG